MSSIFGTASPRAPAPAADAAVAVEEAAAEREAHTAESNAGTPAGATEEGGRGLTAQQAEAVARGRELTHGQATPVPPSLSRRELLTQEEALARGEGWSAPGGGEGAPPDAEGQGEGEWRAGWAGRARERQALFFFLTPGSRRPLPAAH
jgi:hypothetical protein